MRGTFKKLLAGTASVAIAATLLPALAATPAAAAGILGSTTPLSTSPSGGGGTTVFTIGLPQQPGRSVTANTVAGTTVSVPGGGLNVRDVGRTVTGTGIPGGAAIATVPSATTFTLSIAATAIGTGVTLALGANNAACSGDSLNSSWTTNSYVVPVSVDPAGLTFNSSGPVPLSTTNATFRQPLYNVGGNAFADRFTNASGPGLPGFVGSTGIFDFNTTAFPAGVYNMGIACIDNLGAMQEYWNSKVTVGAAKAWNLGAISAAPIVTAPGTGGSVNGNLQITVNVDPPAGDATVTSYTITGAGAPVTINGAAGFDPAPVVITGLTNGTTYNVSATATNPTGTSTPSTPAVAFTPTLPASPAPTGLLANPGAPGAIDLIWTAPAASAATLTGYNVVVTAGGSPITGSPFPVTAPTTTLTIPGLAAGTLYSWSVEALYATPNFSNPVNGPSPGFTVNGSAFVYQDITATRPADALVLTQVCGRYGSMSPEGWTTVPGLGGALPPVSGGTIPTGESPARFAEYPFPSPATYPTRCGINMGTAQLVTTGPNAGAFFAAEGRLNQVTVVDTRLSNPAGWVLNGRVDAQFVSGSANFSGTQLGWTPQVTSATAGQTPVAGANIAPNSTGLVSNQPLMTAANGSDLGIAVADARLKLLIPVAAVSGTYTATLTISVI